MPRNSARNPKIIFSRIYLEKKNPDFFPGPWIPEIFCGSFWNTYVGHVCHFYAKFFLENFRPEAHNNKEPIVLCMFKHLAQAEWYCVYIFTIDLVSINFNAVAFRLNELNTGCRTEMLAFVFEYKLPTYLAPKRIFRLVYEN